MQKLHSSRPAGPPTPRGPKQNRYKLANDGPTHPKSKRGPNIYTYTVCFSLKYVINLKREGNRIQKNSAKIFYERFTGRNPTLF